jgi:hypothetical protein
MLKIIINTRENTIETFDSLPIHSVFTIKGTGVIYYKVNKSTAYNLDIGLIRSFNDTDKNVTVIPARSAVLNVEF